MRYTVKAYQLHVLGNSFSALFKTSQCSECHGIRCAENSVKVYAVGDKFFYRVPRIGIGNSARNHSAVVNLNAILLLCSEVALLTFVNR